MAVIACRTAEAQYVDLFLRVAESCVELLDGVRESAAVGGVLRRLVDLFRQAELPPISDVVGLWGELLLISKCRDPEYALRCWHANPVQLHDFVSSSEAVEVKTTRAGSRKHHVSLAQVASPPTLLLASIMVGSGEEMRSIDDLVDGIGVLVGSPSLSLKIEEVVVRTLGRSWRDAAEVRFGALPATESLRFFEAYRVPRLTGPFPPEISDIRYAVELDGSQPLAIESVRSMGPLAAALTPRSRE